MAVKVYMKVAVLYRVMQGWRVPIFERLSHLPNVEDLCVFHGGDFVGTKVINHKGDKDFQSKCLPTIKVNLKSKNGRICLPVNLTLLFELIRYRPDVVLCEGASNLFNAGIGFVYKVLFRKKMIWWSLGELQNRRKSLLRKIFDSLIRLIEKNADAIICYSSFGAQYFHRIGIPDEKVFVAVNVIDTDRKLDTIRRLNREGIYQESHVKSDFNIVFVGAITKEKRLDVLLEAFAKLEQTVSGARLTIVGDGECLAECKAQAKALEIRGLTFTGRVIDGVSAYFLGADLFVLPGLGGLAVSEALVHGLPVIASIADGCEKDLLGTGAGIIDEALDAERLYMHLSELHSDRIKLDAMKLEAERVIDSVYNIHTYMDQINKCLNNLVPEKV